MRLFLLVLTYDSHSRREGRAEHPLKSSKICHKLLNGQANSIIIVSTSGILFF